VNRPKRVRRNAPHLSDVFEVGEPCHVQHAVNRRHAYAHRVQHVNHALRVMHRHIALHVDALAVRAPQRL